MDPRQEELRRRLGLLGFDDVRFARLSPGQDPGRLSSWLEAGHHADMDWMERTAEKRSDPGLVLEGAASAVLLGVNYLREEASPPGAPRWARYSLNGDYHDSVREGLARAGAVLEEVMGASPGDYRYYVDTGPVLERAWAARAGLGFVGKNAMLISRRHGNWLFLAAILTRLPLEGDPPVRDRGDPGAVGLLCGSCTRCLTACPTAAFPSPGVVDARRCISYHTIENKGVVPREFREAIGDRIYGCDTCLEVCPWNRFARQGRGMLLSARGEIARIPLEELLGMTPERFAAAFKGTAIKRLKLRGLLRNACIVAGNSGDMGLIGPLLKLVRHENPIVRGHAVWAVGRLGGGEGLAEPRTLETDPGVLAEYDAALRGRGR